MDSQNTHPSLLQHAKAGDERAWERFAALYRPFILAKIRLARPQEALAHLKERGDLQPKPGPIDDLVSALCHTMLNNKDEARKLLAQAEAAPPKDVWETLEFDILRNEVRTVLEMRKTP